MKKERKGAFFLLFICFSNPTALTPKKLKQTQQPKPNSLPSPPFLPSSLLPFSPFPCGVFTASPKNPKSLSP